MSEKVDTSLQGIEYDGEYEQVEVEHEMFSDESDVVISTGGRDIEIFERRGLIVAAERGFDHIHSVSVYNSEKVSIEAVSKYYSQYEDWEVVFTKDGVDMSTTRKNENHEYD